MKKISGWGRNNVGRTAPVTIQWGEEGGVAKLYGNNVILKCVRDESSTVKGWVSKQ